MQVYTEVFFAEITKSRTSSFCSETLHGSALEATLRALLVSTQLHVFVDSFLVSLPHAAM